MFTLSRLQCTKPAHDRPTNGKEHGISFTNNVRAQETYNGFLVAQPVGRRKSQHTISAQGEHFLPTFRRHMARLSKTTPFDIYEDQDIEDLQSSFKLDQGDAVPLPFDKDALSGFTLAQEEDFVTDSEDETGREGHDNEHAQHNERRDSHLTKISLSSVPVNSVHGDAYLPHTPTLDQTPLQRPHSSLGVPMSSPTPWLAGSSKGSISRGSRIRAGTPRSHTRNSPMPRRRAYASVREPKVEQQPLVLLHVKLLPVSLPWSLDLMREVLPKRVLDNLRLLRSKATETVLERGVLLPHPGDDYELLEERLLEALELQAPRITKCGHFRSRQSTSSTLSAGSEGSDSGIGSSVEGLDEELCSACHHHISATKGKWWIRVFAANGLMRANTWAAAWSEMERVDVEIMPFIGEKLRMRLDEKKMEQKMVNEKEDIEPVVEKDATNELTPHLYEVEKEGMALFEPELSDPHQARMQHEDLDVVLLPELRDEGIPESQADGQRPARDTKQSGYQDLPQVYRPRDIPLSILLRNYILLLARDRRKVAVFFLALVGLFFALRPAAIPPPEPFVPSTSLRGEPEVPGYAGMDADMIPDAAALDGGIAFPTASKDTPTGDMAANQEVDFPSQVEDPTTTALEARPDKTATTWGEVASETEEMRLSSDLDEISLVYHVDVFEWACAKPHNDGRNGK